jgi:diguanylate cyclase (GGDEF)-like protein
MVGSSRTGNHCALLFIDLDHFKTLNDTLGHDKGDMLLQLVAQRLCLCVREGDTVARLGGDEFVVVLENLNTSFGEATQQTKDIAEKILSALQGNYRLGELDHHSTASVGAAVFLGTNSPSEELLKQADLAMYKSKERGRNRMQFFDPAMQTLVEDRARLEAELRTAIAQGQIMLYYQAQVVDQGRITGAEVLARWQHPTRGLLEPDAFIPLAEDCALIIPLGQWVLAAACTQLALWAKNPGMAHLTLAVNISVKQFQMPCFVEDVLSTLQTTGANPLRLKLELTENLLVNNMQDVVEKMADIQAQGVGFSLDDFGTGYSSLAYLQRMPLEQLKVDRSFVRDILSNPHDASIATTIIGLARSLGLSVLAEGVELLAQRDFLALSGCNAYQGFYFGRPLPLAAFEGAVRAGA